MASLNLSNRLFGRNDDRPTPKQRFADLKTTVAHVMKRKPVPLPEPGSEDARIQWHAALKEVDQAMREAREEYPELQRGPLDWWTKAALTKALDAREITPAEYARLHTLAAQRELRTDVALVAANLGALHVLRYADDYSGPPEVDEETGTDPVFAAINVHRAAHATFRATVNRADRVWVEQNGGDTSPAAMALARDAYDVAQAADVDAWNALFEEQPTTLAGLLALTRHVQEYADEMDGVADALPCIFALPAGAKPARL